VISGYNFYLSRQKGVMPLLPDNISRIKAFLFDVDGVLSADISTIDKEGEPVRTACLKDGYAIRMALSKGFVIGIITGGGQKRVRLRYQKLGVIHFYDHSSDKKACYHDFIFQTDILPEAILYMGDDLPDIPVMKEVGLAACPLDAVAEVKEISGLISCKPGGTGCVREVIEMVMKAQDLW
jgi:3-deoxy-D-manno-octulosonate 8-phosphate phosphatase (KDO 8-P phosphatase)